MTDNDIIIKQKVPLVSVSKEDERDSSDRIEEKIKAIFNEKYVTYNIGGEMFTLSLGIINKYPNSRLYKDYYENKPLFYNKSYDYFHYLIEIMRSGTVLHYHQSLDPRDINVIHKELIYYELYQDLPNVKNALTCPSFSDTKWFINDKMKQYFKQIIPLQQNLFEYDVHKCKSSILLSRVLNTLPADLSITVDLLFSEENSIVYFGLINEKYCQTIHQCICQNPKNVFCLLSNGNLMMNGKCSSYSDYAAPKAGCSYDILINLNKTKTIEFNRLDNEEIGPLKLEGNDFYFIWGACQGKGTCKLTFNNQ